MKAAQAAAQLFAKNNNIHYDDTLRELTTPVITVFKREKIWFPAELSPDKVRFLTKFEEMDLGGSQQEAIETAKLIALTHKVTFIPNIGISLDKQGQY